MTVMARSLGQGKGERTTNPPQSLARKGEQTERGQVKSRVKAACVRQLDERKVGGGRKSLVT